MPERGVDNKQDAPSAAPKDFHNVSRSLLRSEQAKRWTKKYRTEVAASSSSLLSTFAAYPLDSVKTRLQAYAPPSPIYAFYISLITYPRYNFNSFSDCLRHTYKTEGFHGFWRGVWSPLASITLVRTVSFSIYQKSKYALDDWMYQVTGRSPLVIANTKDALPNIHTITCFGLSGGMAGAAITTIACKRIMNTASLISSLID